MLSDNPHLTRVRRLSIGLILSGALNIMLVCLFFYYTVKERPPTPYFELKPADKKEQQAPLAIDRSNSEVIRYFKSFSIDQLIAKLSQTKMIDNGYKERDLALSALVAFHYFNLERSLLGLSPPDQERIIVFGKYRDGTKAEITVYPGLSDQHFQAIINFANTEKWPLTSKGLFKKLQDNEQVNDHTLLDAFYLTHEFLAVEMLFNRAEVPINQEEILKVLLEGDWKMIADFMEQQRIAQDLSPARRQKFLLDYIDNKSHAAAYLILKTDGDFAFRKLDDHHILTILDLLDVGKPEAEKFSIGLLTSPRSNSVRNKAAETMKVLKGDTFSPEKPILKNDLIIVKTNEQAVVTPNSRSEPEQAPKNLVLKTEEKPVPKITKPIPSPPLPSSAKLIAQSTPASKSNNSANGSKKRMRAHIVQEGDSLWKVSQKYKVSVEEIRKLNKLQSDNLKPGSLLNIPT